MLLIDALKLTGYGRFHVGFYFLSAIVLVICGAHINLNIFIAYDPLHRCKVPDDANWTLIQAVGPSQYIPGKTVYDACTAYAWTKIADGVYAVDNTTQNTPCPDGFQYLEGIGTQTLTADAADVAPDFGPTLMMELKVTCNTPWQWALPALSSIAIFPFQSLSIPFMDRLGRKSTMCLLFAVSGMMLSITPYVGTFWNLWVVRCISRIFMQVAYLAATRVIVELTPMDERHCTVFLLVAGYGSGHIFLGILQYILNSNWHSVDYAVSVCTLLFTPVLVLLYPESPLFWVVNVNREKEAEKVVRRIAYWNRVQLPIDFVVDPSPMLTNVLTRTPPKLHSFLIRSWCKLWYNPFIWHRWLFATLAWFVMYFVWVASSVIRLVSPLYFLWNFLAIGLSVMAGGALTQILLRVFKRMEVFVAYCFLSCIAFFIDAAVNSAEGSYMMLDTETPNYIARGFFYCITTATSLSSLAVVRMQSAEIRAEECQPGIMFWMLTFGTFGGAIAMYYPHTTSSIPATVVGQMPIGLWLTPLCTGLMTFLMGVATLIWFFDIDYLEDCRWRERFFACIRRYRGTATEVKTPVTTEMKNRAMRAKRLSITSAGAT